MRYVVLGTSAAGINGVRQLRKQCPEAEIILVSKDSSIYSRCILHHYLGNMRTKEELCFAEDDFEDRYKADWRKGVTCTGLDDKEKQVCLSDGTSIAYDRLLIATGSHTLLPAVKGLLGTEGVYGFHNLDEVEAIKKGAVKAEHIVVLGGEYGNGPWGKWQEGYHGRLFCQQVHHEFPGHPHHVIGNPGKAG